MKPIKAIGLLLAGTASSTAFAQSSVTLYGLVDLSIEYANAQPKNSGSVVRMVQGGENPSRFGFRGVEDLGGGLKAIFQLENGFDPSNGTQLQNRLWGRYAYVGLQNRFGKLMFGRNTTPLFDFARKYDPQRTYYFGIQKQDAGFNDRADRAIKYMGQFGDVGASMLYSTGWDGAGEVPGQSKVGREWSGSLTYAHGPFSIGGVAEQYFGTTVETQNNRTRFLTVAMRYQAGPATAYVGYKNANVNTSNRAAVNNLYWGGVDVDLGSYWNVADAVYYTHYAGNGSSALTIAATVNYFLSKRTNVYVSGAVGRTHGTSTLGIAGEGTADPNSRQVGLMAGVLHRF